MKRYKYLLPALFLTMCSFTMEAQEPQEVQDSTFTSIRIGLLKEDREFLKKLIEEEDAKRNKTIIGVSPERMEIINEQQDSVCLELRSQLVAIELELKELVPDQLGATLNQLLHPSK